MSLHLTNSMSGKKEPFQPIDPKNVRLYVCGPTVYDFAHIGNARPPVVFDLLFRLLRHVYGEGHVTYARNITDIDDKIIARAAESGTPIATITEKFARIYREDMTAIHVLPPSIEPHATDHIAQMVAMIADLMDKALPMRPKGTCCSMCPPCPIMASLAIARGMKWWRVRGWRWPLIKKTRRILCCGNPVIRISPVGIARGARDAPVGIWNVRP
ncbi:hypothetical protein JCM17844_01290 [Iodidimonas gelatinilytica]|uniref:tRNA synthetases class I catalytic domain-containing protein n=1 Tax=Iodidimonas gelatinilytica TaxID=1236966 RepID=A0A5A7MKE4_9PROT|nr:hypothetical protein [Iodidimonas gelatinilytica]GEQ96492.1 hypothetical protein JCM17844_01290 [Iodidimonas gelatinilytica]